MTDEEKRPTRPLSFAIVSTVLALLSLVVVVATLLVVALVWWWLWGTWGFWGIVFGVPASALLVVFVEAYVTARLGSRLYGSGGSSHPHGNTARRTVRAARGRGVVGRSSRSLRSR